MDPSDIKEAELVVTAYQHRLPREHLVEGRHEMFRPVSNLNVVPKLLDKNIAQRFLKRTCLPLSISLQAYRHSTEPALLQV